MNEEKSSSQTSLADAPSATAAKDQSAASLTVAREKPRKRSRLWDPKSHINRSYRTENDEQDDTEDIEANALLKRGQQVPCQLEDIVSKLAPRFKGSRAWPQFDSLEPYQQDLSTVNELRKEEARKLVDVSRNPTNPILLSRDSILSKIRASGHGYKFLSLLARNISIALSLCLLDNECINVLYCPQLASESNLEKLVKQADVASRCPITDILSLIPDSNENGLLAATFDVVDYLAAVLARLTTQTSAGSFWIDNVIAVIAARVAKMKYLLVALCDNASTAAQNGADALEQARSTGALRADLEDEEEECEEALRIIEASQKDGTTSGDDAAVSAYCVSQNQYRTGINVAMRHILSSLQLAGGTTLPSETFEICGVVYETGFEGFKTLLFQDKDLQYSASSDRSVLNTSQPALCLLDQTLSTLLAQKGARPPPAGGQTEAQAFVEWSYQEFESDTLASSLDYSELLGMKKSLPVRDLADMITALLPLSLANPSLLSAFTTFRTTMALAGGLQDVVTPFQDGQFGAYCRLSSINFDAEAKRRRILSLSSAFERGRFSRCKLLPSSKRKAVEKRQCNNRLSAPSRGQIIQDELDDCFPDTQQWVVDESSITVSCKSYVATVMAIAIIFAGGGVAIGLTVGERIPGVDPFNLAMYTWLFAAFILLIAKSVKVENWPWRDFLRWRVCCRSVSELASATGVHQDLLLAKLLHDDCGGSILKIRGPYNSVFRNRHDSGFSIDRPLDAAILTLSGLVLFRVVAPTGDAVVCLDCRSGTFLSMVEHQVAQGKSYFICEDLSRVPRSGVGQQRLRLKLTKPSDFKWKRVQGLYGFSDSRFHGSIFV